MVVNVNYKGSKVDANDLSQDHFYFIRLRRFSQPIYPRFKGSEIPSVLEDLSKRNPQDWNLETADIVLEDADLSFADIYKTLRGNS